MPSPRVKILIILVIATLTVSVSFMVFLNETKAFTLGSINTNPPGSISTDVITNKTPDGKVDVAVRVRLSSTFCTNQDPTYRSSDGATIYIRLGSQQQNNTTDSYSNVTFIFNGRYSTQIWR